MKVMRKKIIARINGEAPGLDIPKISIDPLKRKEALKTVYDNIHNVYESDVEFKNKIIDLIATWDAAALSRLATDLENGNLKSRYTKQEPVAVTSPPDGQFYANRPDRKETAPAFIERVYGAAGLLTGEFTRADLRRLDPQAMMGLANWERTNGRAPVNLPTLKERNDQQTAPGGVLTEETKEAIRIAERLRSATRRQIKRQKTQKP